MTILDLFIVQSSASRYVTALEAVCEQFSFNLFHLNCSNPRAAWRMENKSHNQRFWFRQDSYSTLFTSTTSCRGCEIWKA